MLPVFLALASLGGAALYLESTDPAKGSRAPIVGAGLLGDRLSNAEAGNLGCKGPKDPTLLRVLAAKWTAKFPGVRMPNLGLSEIDAADLTSYIETQSLRMVRRTPR